MDFVTPIIEIVSLLWEPIARRVKYITKLQENVQSLRNTKGELMERSSDVKTRVDVAERQGLPRTHEVKGWLERVNDIEVEVNQIEVSFDQRRRCLGNFCLNCWLSYKLGKKVAKKLADVVELKNKGVFNEVAEKSLPDPVTEMPSTSTLGMDLAMEKVRSYLEEDETGVIGIYGMGGVGKTTLLKKINNEFFQKSHNFDMVIWVVVSKELNVANIQTRIGDKLGLSLPNDQDGRFEQIFNILKTKKFVLLLDDIWERLDLEKIGIPPPNNQNKCKVIFTTRSVEVCGKMEARRKIEVECLAWNNAWDLFREKVGEEAMKAHPEIPKLAEEVAKKCDGLPLALNIIGRAMACIKTPQEWKHIIKVLSSSPTKLQGMEDELLSCLKISYDNLSDDTMRECFLYCSLYPEDYNIRKLELIDCWIGEGFLDNSDLDEARNNGHYLIGRLKDACLLEASSSDPESEVKMHDIIRELALWITSENGEKKNNFLVRAGVGLIETPILEKWKEPTRISLMDNSLVELIGEPLICPNLITLMLQQNRKLSGIPNSLFQFMPRLRVLDLSRTGLVDLPTGIGNLFELQYLNLSQTEIVTVPEELVNLAKLNHLNLSFTYNLETIPQKVIARLSSLQVLNLSFSKCKVEDSDDNLLAELEGLRQLDDLGINIGSFKALNRLVGSQILTKCTGYLNVDHCYALTCFRVSSTSGNMKRLKSLNISGCYELRELIIDAEMEGVNHLLPGLMELYLWNLPRLETILVPGGCLQNLVDIEISDCGALKNITWAMYLRSLRNLSIVACGGLEEVIGGEGEAIPQDSMLFPTLQEIYLHNLPELNSICRYPLAFPSSLNKLDVRHCPKLKRLPFSPGNANTTLQEIRGKEEWWHGLEWEDERTKSALLPYFKDLFQPKN